MLSTGIPFCAKFNAADLPNTCNSYLQSETIALHNLTAASLHDSLKEPV